MKEIKYKKLFEPLKVNGVMLKNRIISAPVDVHHSGEKAKGGASLIVLGDGFVSKEVRGRIAKFHHNPFEISKRDVAIETKKMVEFWRQGGALVSIELLHCGQFGQFVNCDYVYGAVQGKRPLDGAEIVEINEEKMQDICSEYYESAAAARSMGFDMVTAHFGHGWLPCQFLSSTWNKRTDEYGGSYENRIKFPRMILQAIRKAVGRDFPIDMRINAKDWVGDGTQIEDVARFLQDMYDEGLLDMANISAGTDINMKGNTRMATHPTSPHMVNIAFSKYLKEQTNGIVITVVGAIHTPDEAEFIIEEGYADAVWIGRSMVADPMWAQKALENRGEDIVPCLRCLYCFPIATGGQNFGCSVNPRFNKEDIPLSVKTRNPKKVVIIGGGPAGMKAAITASLNGHQVMILEKSHQLGGAIRFSDYVEAKQDVNSYMKYLIRQVEKRNIEVQLNYEADYENVKALEPEVLMIAVGAEPIIPPIVGMDNVNVIQAQESFPILDEISQRVVIIGGGTIGCELAVDLAEKNKEVVVVEMSEELNRNANRLYKFALNEKMSEFENINIRLNTTCLEITNESVKIKQKDKYDEILECGNIIVAVGMKSKKALVNSLFGITPETYVLGDCNKVGLIKNATEDGFFFATNILD